MGDITDVNTAWCPNGHIYTEYLNLIACYFCFSKSFLISPTQIVLHLSTSIFEEKVAGADIATWGNLDINTVF